MVQVLCIMCAYIYIYLYADTCCPRFPSNIGKCLNTFGIYVPYELVFSICMNPELVSRHRMKLEIGKYPFRDRVLVVNYLGDFFRVIIFK